MRNYNSPGFRFHPTDEELVCFYLKKKVIRDLQPCFDHVAVVDIYKFEPWDLPRFSRLKTRDLEWYFYTVLDKKYGNGFRTNRATDRGYWKTTGKDRVIKNGEDTVGMKKTLVYHLGRAPHGDRTNWVMHEYRMLDEKLASAGVQDAYVLCRIFEKSGSGPKNGEKYGAPFVESEWDHGNEQVNPVPPVENEPLKQEVSAAAAAVAAVPEDGERVEPLAAVDNEPLKEKVPAPTDDDYVETRDLDQDIDNSPTVGSAELTVGSAELTSNFCYGESSSYPQYPEAFINDHKQLEAAFGIYDHQFDQTDNMADLYGMAINSAQDGYSGETNHYENQADMANLYGVDIDSLQDGFNGENPLNFNFASEDPDLYFDANGFLSNSNEEVYMEANDLKNLDEDVSTHVDPSVAAMLDEYLASPDDDIFNHICFDSPLGVGSESSISNIGQPFIQQNTEGETNGNSLANKHVFEAQAGNEPFPKGDAEASSWVSGDANSFVKQANKLLASIPAPPAFASEFPSKEFALGMHPAAESSNSGHITAGMISITDITFRGNAMDWMVGKNGGFNTIMSTGFSQTDVNSATLVPISSLVCSKTDFMLSHGWVFLMGFSVVILSLSCKIGSFMYTGK